MTEIPAPRKKDLTHKMTSIKHQEVALKKTTKIIFESDHLRITPYSEDQLMACEPIEIAQMIYLVRNQDWLFEQIKNKSWRECVLQVDSYDITRVSTYISSHVLDNWIKFLIKVIMKRENAHEKEQSDLALRDRRYVEKLLRYLTRTTAFAIYLEREQTKVLFSIAGAKPQDLLDSETATVDGLLEARRWCGAYASVLERGNCQSYFTENSIEIESLARMSVFQLRKLSISIAESKEKTAIFEKIVRQYPGIQPDTRFDLKTITLRELQEAEAMLEAKISYNNDGQIIALQID